MLETFLYLNILSILTFEQMINIFIMPFKVLDQIVYTSLVEASKLHLRSIAFPAIGTKGLRYPIADVAAIMAKAIARFSGDYAQTTIKLIYFAFLKQDTEIFQVRSYLHV